MHKTATTSIQLPTRIPANRHIREFGPKPQGRGSIPIGKPIVPRFLSLAMFPITSIDYTRQSPNDSSYKFSHVKKMHKTLKNLKSTFTLTYHFTYHFFPNKLTISKNVQYLIFWFHKREDNLDSIVKHEKSFTLERNTVNHL